MFLIRRRLVLMMVLALAGIGLLGTNAYPSTAQDDLAGLHLIGSENGEISVYAPETWLFQSMPANQVYATTLLIAENQAMLDDLFNYQLSLPTSGASEGGFAILTRIAPTFWSGFGTNANQAATNLLDIIVSELPVYDDFTIEIGAEGYQAIIVETVTAELNAQGYLGAFAHDGEVYLFSLMATPEAAFSDYFEILETIGSSVSVPAEAGALTDPRQAQPTPLPTEETVVTPEVMPTEDVIIDEGVIESIQVNAADDTLSIMLPDQWFYQDRTADDNLFVYGSTEAAVDARLYALRPALFESAAAMNGLGGVIELYELADFGLSADNPDVGPLLTQVLDGLVQQGYEIVEEPGAVQLGGYEGQQAVIRGSEYGFLALVAFDTQLGYITATGTGDSFETNREPLLTILQSVRIPAAEPEPAATAQPGLGGLGGLRDADATATPAAGLGGLGGLRGADATEEADTSEADSVEDAAVEEAAATEEA